MHHIQRVGYKLTTKVKAWQISIPCSIPDNDLEDFKEVNWGVQYFYSPYYDAASRYFTVELSFIEDDARCGIIFPAILLDSNNSELYADMNLFQQHAILFGMYALLDNYAESIESSINKNMVLEFSDIPILDNLYIWVYDQTKLSRIDDVLPSLYSNGFLFIQEPFGGNDRFYISDYISRIKENEDKNKKKIKLDSITDTLADFQYLSVLYREILPLNIPPAYRFLLLYQIIEFLMDKKKNEILIENIASYKTRNRGDLRETIASTLKEDLLIDKIFDKIGESKPFHIDFISESKLFLRNIGKAPLKDEHFYNCMYGVRNVLVHNYKEAVKYPDQIKLLAECFELAIIDLVNQVNIKNDDSKLLFVVDKSQKYKENVHRLSKIFHEK